jgi:predicted DNA-binding protein with PD1-like motif
MKLHATRFQPGDDLRQQIATYVKAENITAGVIVSSVGSLSKAVFRLAGAQPSHQPVLERQDEFEIVSLNGTVGSGGMHLHISLSDREGNVIGGHLKDGCILKTTAEIVVAADASQRFDRRLDPQTGFEELVIEYIK